MESAVIYKKEGWKPFLKVLLAIAVPVALQNLLSTTASMVDTVMLATLGEKAVGAIGLCSQFMSLMFSCYWGFVGGGMLFMAQYWGAKDDKGICSAYGLMLCCLLTVGLVFGGMAIFAPQLVMQMYTDKPELWEIGIRYLRVVGFVYPVQVIAMAQSSLLRSTEQVKVPLVASIVSLLTNLVLNYLLIFGKFGFPQLGVLGAAYATLFAGIVNVLMLCVLGKAHHHPYLLRFKDHFHWHKAFVIDYLKKSFPIICNELLIGVGNMVISIVYGRQSTAAIAAVAIFATFNGFLIAFFSGFTNAASVLVGKEVGAGNHELGFHRTKRLVVLTPLVVVAAAALFCCFRDPFLKAMNLTGEAYELASFMMVSFALIVGVRMTNWIQNDSYRSAGDPVFGTVMEITFMYLMVLPCVCLAGLVWKLPFRYVFLAAYVDEFVRIFIMLRNTWKGRWIKPVTKEGLATIEKFRKAHNIVFKKKQA